jgi:hypothetical protein
MKRDAAQRLMQKSTDFMRENNAPASSWSVNGRFLTRTPTGVDRYAREILRAIDALIREGHPQTVGLKLDILLPARAMRSSPFANIPPRLLPSAPGHLWERVILPGYVRGELLSLCNTGPLAVRKQVVCIHNVNTRLTPESYGLMFRATYRLLQRAWAVRRSNCHSLSFLAEGNGAVRYRACGRDRCNSRWL